MGIKKQVTIAKPSGTRSPNRRPSVVDAVHSDDEREASYYSEASKQSSSKEVDVSVTTCVAVSIPSPIRIIDISTNGT